MSAFLRFTLLVAALCAAAVVGYIAGVRNSGPSPPPSQERMSIDTHGTPDSTSRPMAKTTPAPEPRSAEAPAPDAGARNAADDAGPPTSIDEILRRQQAAQTPPN